MSDKWSSGNNPFQTMQKTNEQKLTERVMFAGTGDFYPCDICDEMHLPHVSWHCTHDDPAHVTTICHICLKKIESRSNR